jgi:hypothetical protein
MFVRSDWTRRGLGRALLESCEPPLARRAFDCAASGRRQRGAIGVRTLASKVRARYGWRLASVIFATPSEPPATSLVVAVPVAPLEATGAAAHGRRVPGEDQQRAAQRDVRDAVRLARAEDAVQMLTADEVLRVALVVAAEVERVDVEDVARLGVLLLLRGDHRPVRLGEREPHHLREDPDRHVPTTGGVAGGRPQRGSAGQRDDGGDDDAEAMDAIVGVHAVEATVAPAAAHQGHP